VKAVTRNGPRKPAKKAVIYSRTSSSSNKKGDTHTRQVKAGLCAMSCSGVKTSEKKKLQKVTECISGMLPLAKRKKLLKLIDGTYSHVFVESLRTLARKSSAIEELHEAAKRSGTTIVVADAGPDVFSPEASPAQNFQRRVLAAVTEFERDVIVHRLSSGLKAKAAHMKHITGKTKVKVNGRKSHLEHVLERLGDDNKKKCTLKKQLTTLCKVQKSGGLTWRELAKKASACMKLKKKMGKDAAVTLSKSLGVIK